MTTTRRVSNTKIIAAIALIIVTVLIALFVYRLHNRAQPKQMAADAGTLFAVPRDIKAFKLIQTNNTAFTERDLQGHWTLLFFGFTHCASICPTTLSMLQRVYAQLPSDHSPLNIVFVSLDPTRDSLATLAAYTHNFNANFIGVTGKIENVRKLQSQFGVYSSADTATASNYQIQHTPSIMLINPQGQWAGLFRYGLNPHEFSEALSGVIG